MMNAQQFSVGDVVEVIDLPGYKYNGKRGEIIRLKRNDGLNFADVRLDGKRRSVEFFTLHLKRLDMIQASLFGD